MKNGKQGKRKETLRRGKLPYLEVMEDPTEAVIFEQSP